MTEELKVEVKRMLMHTLIKGGPSMIIVSIFCFVFYSQNMEYARRDEERAKRDEARKIELQKELMDCHQSQVDLLKSGLINTKYH